MCLKKYYINYFYFLVSLLFLYADWGATFGNLSLGTGNSSFNTYTYNV